MALFLVNVTFIEDTAKRMSVRPIHREFLQKMFDEGRLWAAGPFIDDLGGISIYEAEHLAEVEATLANDPYVQNGIFASTDIREWNPIFSRAAIDL